MPSGYIPPQSVIDEDIADIKQKVEAARHKSYDEPPGPENIYIKPMFSPARIAHLLAEIDRLRLNQK